MAPQSNARLVHVVVFSLAGQRYALPLGQVERVVPMVAFSPLPQAPPVVLGVINLHGRAVPVVDLRRRFSLPGASYGLGARLLIARTLQRTLALATDEVAGVEALDTHHIVPADTVFPDLAYVAGVAATSDGLVVIHDLAACLSIDEERQLRDSLAEHAS